ncbi:MAG: hypothetical protein AB7N71_15355, partial [Phycisphaerae bacterium]
MAVPHPVAAAAAPRLPASWEFGTSAAACAAAAAALWAASAISLEEMAWHSPRDSALRFTAVVSALAALLRGTVRSRVEFGEKAETQQRALFDTPTRAAAWMLFAGAVGVLLLLLERSCESLRAWVIATVLIPESARVLLVLAPLMLCVFFIAFACIGAIQCTSPSHQEFERANFRNFYMLGLLASLGPIGGIVLSAFLGPRRGPALLASMGFFLAGLLLAVQKNRTSRQGGPHPEQTRSGLARPATLEPLLCVYFAYWIVSAMIELSRDSDSPHGAIRQTIPFLSICCGLSLCWFASRLLEAGPMYLLCALLPAVSIGVPVRSSDTTVVTAKLVVILIAAMAGITYLRTRRRDGGIAKYFWTACAIGALLAALAPYPVAMRDDRAGLLPVPETSSVPVFGRGARAISMTSDAGRVDGMQIDVQGARYETIVIDSPAIDPPLTRGAIERLLRRCHSALKKNGRILIQLPASGFPGPMFRMQDSLPAQEFACYVLYGTASEEMSPICYLVGGADIEAWTMHRFSHLG